MYRRPPTSDRGRDRCRGAIQGGFSRGFAFNHHGGFNGNDGFSHLSGFDGMAAWVASFGIYTGLGDGSDKEIHNQYGTSYMTMPSDHKPSVPGTVDIPSIKYRPAKQEPIAVYTTTPDSPGFSFLGWFTIEEIQLFAAKSSDLAREMREKKWGGDNRADWAAIKLRRVNKRNSLWRPAPKVKHLEDKPLDLEETMEMERDTNQDTTEKPKEEDKEKEIKEKEFKKNGGNRKKSGRKNDHAEESEENVKEKKAEEKA
ncbi:deedaafe-30ea-41b4-88d9-8a081a9ca191 [Thermothielavioides terrestris]|uniref:Deedaafe-30ea-41b4-88d9-8a081a9ca191 n=1 Tax=Thermothielavioides terrestris TaxID=2587410 RepID=A0A3S4D3L1_9PEZI|nr:deedaafe-30ea-41b4-88d9-8a081a9ca191 [Thermothielavioides terrestris]